MATPNHPCGTRPDQQDWLTLTGLGRLYGISAVLCGRLLGEAGRRQANGTPSPSALRMGLAHGGDHPRGGTLWHRQGCGRVLEAAGLVQPARHTLIGQWADLLSTLAAGAPGVKASVEEMADELPEDLVSPVNAELRHRGCGFQVQPQARRRASACRAAASSSSRRRSSSV